MILVKKIFNISIFLYLLVFTLHCNKQEIYIINGITMGTTYSISIYDYQVNLDTLKYKIDSLLNNINFQMSTYIKNSEISKINKGRWGKILAFFDIETIEGFTIKGFKLVEGSDGVFVGFPSREKDGEYYDTVWAEKELRNEIRELAKREYDNPTEHQEDQELQLPGKTVFAEDSSTEDIPF